MSNERIEDSISTLDRWVIALFMVQVICSLPLAVYTSSALSRISKLEKKVNAVHQDQAAVSNACPTCGITYWEVLHD